MSQPTLTPASFAQRSMWAFALRYRTAHLNEMVIPWRAQGPLDIAALEVALGQLVARHEALRTRLSYQQGKLWQKVMPAEPLPLALEEASGATPEARLQAALGQLGDPQHTPLDILHGPTMRARVVRLASDDHMLCLYVHHAMCDGWSIGIILHELMLLYGARLQGATAALPPLNETFAELARAEIATDESGQFEPDLAYWRAELADLPAPLALPTAVPRKGNRDWRSGLWPAQEPAAFLARLRAAAGGLRISPFALQLSALAVVLRRHGQADDMLIGVPTLNRWSAAAMQTVGYITSLLPLRIRPRAELGFDALGAQVHLSVRRMLAHGRVPLEVLLRETPLAVSGNTVFPVWAQFLEDNAPQPYEAAGLRFTALAVERRNQLAEVDVDLLGRSDGWHCEWAYRAALFDAAAMQSMLADFVHTLHFAIEQPRATVQELTARLD